MDGAETIVERLYNIVRGPGNHLRPPVALMPQKDLSDFTPVSYEELWRLTTLIASKLISKLGVCDTPVALLHHDAPSSFFYIVALHK